MREPLKEKDPRPQDTVTILWALSMLALGLWCLWALTSGSKL